MPGGDSTSYNRETLLAEVWAEPMRNVAKRCGITEQFVYVFDFGDDWSHLCTVGEVRVDPLATLGIVPRVPLPYWGWGDIPDQYRRLWDGDDSESDPPEDPGLADLPPLRPWWGRQDR